MTTGPGTLDPGPRTPDALVIGAGPSGCAAATVLARCGHRVLLVERPASGRRSLAESIPPSANRILNELGMKNAVEAAGFHPWLGNTVWWGSDEPRVESFARGEAGYQVERGRFDEVLRGAAAKAGAEIVRGSATQFSLETGRELRPVEAQIVLDCSGRAGVIARKGLRQAREPHRTVALAGVWRAAFPWPAEQRGHTLVASHADGWAWSVPTSDDTRYVTVMVDPERSHLARGVAALEVYRNELRKVEAFAPLLEHAELAEGPWGADASLYDASAYSGPGFLLVGDAASFIDPLSSFGVKKALASGWLAGVTANTILKTPEMADEARAFYEHRERAVVESFRLQTAQFAAGAGGAAAHPFWEARVGKTTSEVVFPTAAENDLRGRAAFEDLRRRSGIHLRQGDQVRTAPRAAIRNNLIVMEDHIFVPEWPDGVRYLRNIDIALVLRLAPDYRDVGELYEAVFRAQPGIALHDFLAALSTLVAVGALQHKM